MIGNCTDKGCCEHIGGKFVSYLREQHDWTIFRQKSNDPERWFGLKELHH